MKQKRKAIIAQCRRAAVDQHLGRHQKSASASADLTPDGRRAHPAPNHTFNHAVSTTARPPARSVKWFVSLAKYRISKMRFIV